LKRVRTLINFAIELEWTDIDPTKRVRSCKSKEFHTWTEDEIGQFEARWPFGTPQRLAFAISLCTGQRGSDAHWMARPDAAGNIRVVQQKTGASLVIACHPNLLATLDALPKKHVTMLTTAYGEPFTVKGFGQFMAAAISAAGLPVQCNKAHGLRKAAARRLAEALDTASRSRSHTPALRQRLKRLTQVVCGP
jgi:integrase